MTADFELVRSAVPISWRNIIVGFGKGTTEKIHEVLRVIGEELRARFNIDLRSHQLPIGSEGQPPYTRGYCERVCRETSWFAFGDHTNSLRFCTHSDGRSCKVLTKGGNTCEGKETDRCSLKRPHFILVTHAEGPNKERLLMPIRRFAFRHEIEPEIASLPKRDLLQNQRERIYLLARRYLRLAKLINADPRIIATPLVLPVLNFKAKTDDILDLIDTAQNPSLDFEPDHKRISRLYAIPDRGGSVRGFRDRRQIDFKIDQTAQHGRASVDAADRAKPVYTLSTFFRCGVPLNDFLQFDVDRPPNGSDPLNASFYCAKLEGHVGPISATHVNIYPNDRIN